MPSNSAYISYTLYTSYRRRLGLNESVLAPLGLSALNARIAFDLLRCASCLIYSHGWRVHANASVCQRQDDGYCVVTPLAHVQRWAWCRAMPCIAARRTDRNPGAAFRPGENQRSSSRCSLFVRARGVTDALLTESKLLSGRNRFCYRIPILNQSFTKKRTSACG